MKSSDLTRNEAIIACAVFAESWWGPNSSISWETAIARAQCLLGRGGECFGRNAPARVLAALGEEVNRS